MAACPYVIFFCVRKLEMLATVDFYFFFGIILRICFLRFVWYFRYYLRKINIQIKKEGKTETGRQKFTEGRKKRISFTIRSSFGCVIVSNACVHLQGWLKQPPTTTHRTPPPPTLTFRIVTWPSFLFVPPPIRPVPQCRRAQIGVYRRICRTQYRTT